MSIKKTDLVTVRSALPDDANFILSTYLRGLYYGGSIFSEMKKQTFMQKYHYIVMALLKNPSNIKVSCLKEDPTVILGYAILNTDHTVLHYMFCKKSWRNIGIITDLLPSTVKYVTHLTKVGEAIARKRGWEFDPFLLEVGK